MNTKKKNLRMIAVTAIMSALSAVLMFVEFSIPIMPAFIKLDVSELPALITSFTFGPVCGVAVCLVKNLIHLFVTSIFVFVAGMFYKHKHNRKYALIGAMAGDLAMAVLCFFVNLFFVYPLYIKLMLPEEAILGMYRAILPSVDSLWKAILIFNVPFTFVKGLISVAITFIVYPKLSPILKGKK